MKENSVKNSTEYYVIINRLNEVMKKAKYGIGFMGNYLADELKNKALNEVECISFM